MRGFFCLFWAVALFLSPSLWAQPYLDHCTSCRVSSALKPQSAEGCTNLLAFGGERAFFKHFESRLGNIKKLSAAQQITKFLASFKEVTKDFSNRLSDGDPQQAEIKRRLLGSVGWTTARTWKDIEDLVRKNRRVRMAAEQLVCDLMTSRKARGDCDGSLSSLNDLERATFQTRFEDSVLSFVAQGISNEEILQARVFPSEETRTRLLVALMKKYDISNSLIFAVPKNDLVQACTMKTFVPVEFSLFTFISSEGMDWLTRVNETKAGARALQSFPNQGEWVSLTIDVPSERAVAATKALGADDPVCFMNASQMRDYACGIWRKQK